MIEKDYNGVVKDNCLVDGVLFFMLIIFDVD